MDADDRMVAGVVAGRARHMANLAVLMGAVGVLLSVVPWTGLPLPAAIYGVCTVIPLVLGLAGSAGAIASLRVPVGQPPGVREAMRTRGLGTARALAVVAIVLGLLGFLSGVISLATMQLVEPLL